MDSLAIILICVPLFVPIPLAHGFDLRGSESSSSS